MNPLRQLFLLSSFFTLSQWADAQVMRSQVYEPFMKAQILQRRGQDSAAIECLNQVANLVPNFPPTYLRQAEIFNDMYQRNGSKEALSAAVFMYRKYLTLEFNEALIKEPGEKLRRLEDILQVAHFEEEESKDGDDTKETLLVITDSESAKTLVANSSYVAPKMTKQVELVPMISSPASTASTQQSSVPEPTAVISETSVEKSVLIPDLGSPVFSYLNFYKSDFATTVETAPVTNVPFDSDNLTGHWVSETIQPDGRELWIFDIKPQSPEECVIMFSNLSGIVNEYQDQSDVFHRALSLTKTYLQKTNILANTKSEVVNEYIKAKITPQGVKFDVEVENTYVGGTTLYKWSKNLVNNLQAVLPFGAVINNYVNNYVDQRQALDKTKSTTTTYTFNFSPKSNGVIGCEISSVVKSVGENGKAKSKIGPTINTSFFRTDANYTVGQDEREYSSKSYGNWEELFARVKADAKVDINYNYPLAILYYYGVGTSQDTGDAIECMTSLATCTGDTRAKAWLASYFYNKAYTDDSQNTFIRRRYVKSAQYWSSQLHSQSIKDWYGVKGDMCSSDQTRDIFTSLQDSAIYYYKLGDEAGDPYATYRLGSIYLQGEKKNLPEAQRLLLKAANAGNENAILELANLALLKNDLQAYKHNLHLAADMGCPDAYSELGKAYSKGPSHGFKLDPITGLRMNRLAIRAEKDDWIPVLLSYGYKLDKFFD